MELIVAVSLYQCIIREKRQPDAHYQPYTTRMAADLKSLILLLSNIRKHGTFSDLLVFCEPFTFRVHRCIVCPQSQYSNNAHTFDVYDQAIVERTG
ncbi:hypothetical protein ASPACDRAFT_122433 [Aspergillus aculeatus ATCC 16872]|uniref:BTB domain-containing protein n=1 Tax=Aspergillus aculeatus (strain ATCC 16872 / CBS 172.66 / WB 5094) TaxID=690307 RepID=A0A1L9WR61_ASPA1|nr:uncharacterized protein ASPACDRAFT_122433 [Aspergillus aculeatus ATCC 16872]OJJ98568.1 hypothetical protein ASPACDRAFT_122433 [Aspergillus aculeatus ATCC 16872]